MRDPKQEFGTSFFSFFFFVFSENYLNLIYFLVNCV